MPNATVRSECRRDEPNRLKVCVFGRLRVINPDGTVFIPTGDMQRALLLLLALRGGAVHVEQVADALWPGVSVAIASARLRNVLQRLRDTCGPIVLREGGSVILDADTDLAEYEAALITLLTVTPTELALDALYDDWTAPVRRRLDVLRDKLVHRL